MEQAISLKTAEEAAAYLRAEERRRCNEIRTIVINSINDKPIRIDDIVDGGPLPYPECASQLAGGHRQQSDASGTGQLRSVRRSRNREMGP